MAGLGYYWGQCHDCWRLRADVRGFRCDPCWEAYWVMMKADLRRKHWKALAKSTLRTRTYVHGRIDTEGSEEAAKRTVIELIVALHRIRGESSTSHQPYYLLKAGGPEESVSGRVMVGFTTGEAHSAALELFTIFRRIPPEWVAVADRALRMRAPGWSVKGELIDGS